MGRALLVLMLSGLWASSLNAQQLEGAARIHTDLSIVSAVGSGGDSVTRFGFFNTLGFGVGYMASEELLVGTRIGIGYSDPIVDFQLMPYFEFLYAASESARIGMALVGGMEVLSANSSSTVIGAFGGGPVLHALVGDTLFSLDPGLLVQGLFAEGGSAWNIQLVLGFSGWPGARREAEPPETERKVEDWYPAPRRATQAPTYKPSEPAVLVKQMALGETYLQVAAQPERNPQAVTIRFTRNVKALAWKDCTQAIVDRDGQRYVLELKHKAVQRGMQVEERVQATVGINFVESLGTAKELRFEVCGEALPSNSTSYVTVRTFVHMFHHKAKNYYGAVVAPISDPPLLDAEAIEEPSVAPAEVASPPAPIAAPDAAPVTPAAAPAASPSTPPTTAPLQR